MPCSCACSFLLHNSEWAWALNKWDWFLNSNAAKSELTVYCCDPNAYDVRFIVRIVNLWNALVSLKTLLTINIWIRMIWELAIFSTPFFAIEPQLNEILIFSGIKVDSRNSFLWLSKNCSANFHWYGLIQTKSVFNLENEIQERLFE